MSYESFEDWQRKRENRERRKQRVAAARLLGTHTEEEWIALCQEMGNRCVRCGIAAAELYGGTLTKDHIRPFYQGGCDCIQNLQPMCRNCNSSKGPENRNWIEHRRGVGFGDVE